MRSRNFGRKYTLFVYWGTRRIYAKRRSPRGGLLQKPFRLATLAEQLKLVPRKV